MPLDMRGTYRLLITHESGSEAAEWVADHLAQSLAGSAYLRVRRLPSHAPIKPTVQGDASIHIAGSVRIEQSSFADTRRRNGMLCSLGELDCGRRDDFYDFGTLWGTLEITLLRVGFPVQERTLVDHIDRGPKQTLYQRLALRAENLLQSS